MKSVISNHKHQTYKNKLLSKICRLKKIISVIIYLNKEFEKKYSTSINKEHFTSEKVKELGVHHQGDILRVLNSNICKENKKETTINTLRPDLRFLVKLKALEKKILTFSNNFGEFKGKLCIYKVSPIAHKLIDAYFSSTKADLIKKVKEEKDVFKKEKGYFEPQNITENITVYNKLYINIYNKNSIESSLFKRIKSIASNTKNPIATLKNALLNYKDFKNYLKYDYVVEDIKEFFLSKLNLYKDKIHFMRKTAPYKTDFYILAGEFKDVYTTKWKKNKKTSFSGHAGIIANNILANILTKGLKFE
ncbi:borrelia PFam57/62 partition protein (plasmid) [Borreliella bissettiae DN127]|uniref:Borrelia PFam57/62 partition protein n=1 Tax=Borrelia bissettiae (strain DSM 17990 / CIP 109136 / DN127) TaxID=521010 RepID=G0AP44_BORBD|nr:plasmid maintenance protein [Borreliella bissettiae]AEL19470.1 borrelia PFam57/62 partition protein [Borreliella bissettiae DN127]